MIIISLSTTLQVIGLLIDFIGAILLVKYGIASMIETNGASLLVGAVDPEVSKIESRYKKISKCGAVMLCVGFAFQFIGQIIK